MPAIYPLFSIAINRGIIIGGGVISRTEGCAEYYTQGMSKKKWVVLGVVESVRRGGYALQLKFFRRKKEKGCVRADVCVCVYSTKIFPSLKLTM